MEGFGTFHKMIHLISMVSSKVFIDCHSGNQDVLSISDCLGTIKLVKLQNFFISADESPLQLFM